MIIKLISKRASISKLAFTRICLLFVYFTYTNYCMWIQLYFLPICSSSSMPSTQPPVSFFSSLILKIINVSLSFTFPYRSSWSSPSITMLTPPRYWKAHCGGKPNVYTVLALAGCLYVISGLRLTQTFHQQAASLLQWGQCCIRYLSAVFPQGDMSDTER